MAEDDDPVMKMYEAQATIIERDAEIQALLRKVAELEVNKAEEATASSNDDVWTAIRNLEKQMEQSTSTTERLEGKMVDATSGLELTVINMLQRMETLEDTLRIVAAKTRSVEEPAVQDEKKTVKEKSKQKNEANEESETILIMGGKSGWGAMEENDQISVLNREGNEWKRLAFKLPLGNRHGGAAYLSGEIYIFGGSALHNNLFKLDISQMKWKDLAKMKEKRTGIGSSSIVFQGCIWVLGGWGSNDDLNSVEKYCPETDKWTQMPAMRGQRSWAAAAVCNGKIFVCGGDLGGIPLSSSECYDPESRIWTLFASMPTGLKNHSMVSQGGCLIVMGGCDTTTAFDSVWKIKPQEQLLEKSMGSFSTLSKPSTNESNWETLRVMRDERVDHSTVSINNEIFVIGGEQGRGNRVEIFDGESWRYGPSLPNPCCAMSAIVIPKELADTLCRFQN